MLQIDLYELDLCLCFVHSFAMYFVSVTRHFSYPWFACTSSRLYICMYVREYIHTYICMYICMYVQIPIARKITKVLYS